MKKIKTFWLSCIALVLTYLALSCLPIAGQVYAAGNPPGTCFLGPGTNKCSGDNIKGKKDSNGNPVDISKYCYSIGTSNGKNTVITQVDCDTGKPSTSSTPPANTTPTNGLPNDCASGITSCSLVTKYLKPLIKFLAALVGVAVVFSIIIGGIQYASSADDPSKVTAAKNRIRNAIIALVTFIFLFALLNFLIPGGLV